MFSQPFILYFVSILLPHLDFNLELVPEIEAVNQWLKNKTKSPLPFIIIRQQANNGPLCENHCIANAQQVIITMQIQGCWTQSLADLR